MTVHPDDTQIRNFLSGDASDPDDTGLEAHLEHCETCAARADDLRAEHDLWIERLRSAGAPPREPPPKPRIVGLPREGLPGYVIGEEIGRGGQGIVYRAIQNSTKRDVAVKVLLEGPYASVSARRRFEREVELVAGFRHPNIVTVFDSGTMADSRGYCVMDYVQGTRLGDFVRSERLDTKRVLALFAVVCDAVNYAHQRGVIHRDLKPSNVLVDENGEPRILDFGLAKNTADTQDAVVTDAGLAAGTLPYLSPEQARGEPSAVDIRTDVYACGVILYELLTASFPYPVTGELASVLRHITDTPPKPLGHAHSASGPSGWRNNDIDTILQKALAKEPDRRYQSAGALAEDIRLYLSGEPITARRHSRWYVISKAVRRHKLPVLSAAAGVLLITAAAVVLAVLVRRQGRLLVDLQHQTDAARSAETAAEERFDQVRELANAFINEFEPAVRDLVGATQARELVVAKGLEYLNALAASADTDIDLQADLGRAYLRIANVQGDPQIANLGDQRGAHQNYNKGLALLRAVAEARPHSVDAGRNLYLAHHRLANLERAMGAREQARLHIAEARRTLDALLATHPQTDLRLELSNINEWIAEDLRHHGQFQEALDLQRTTLRIREDLSEAPLPTRAVAVSHQMIGELLVQLDRPQDALVSQQNFLDISLRRAQADPGSAVAMGDVSVARDKVGFCHQALGHTQEALGHYRAGLNINAALVAEDPSDVTARGRLAIAHCRVGELELASGETNAAKASFEAYHLHSNTLATIRPDSPGTQRELGVARYKMAELHMTLGADGTADGTVRVQHWRDAERWMQRCMEVFAGLRDREQLSPADVGVPDDIARHIERCRKEVLALTGRGQSAE